MDPEFEGLSQIDGYEATQATNALIVETVFRRKGISRLRALMPFRGTPDALLALLAQDIPELARDGDRWWKRTAAFYAGGR